ncbi:MAG TPA: J domain-containing protein [Nocardioidaceae bacterium]|nr:J domain-containing protein [Nocardioidaceae bacterium]
MTSPTLYDILGVRPEATSEEIKAAWRDAAERFEPGSGGSAGQFRLFNEAAEVLLDPERRTAYDEQLSSEREAAVVTEPDPATRDEQGETDAPTTPGRPGTPSRTVPVAVLAVLAVLAAATMGVALYLGAQYQRASEYQDALDQAPSSAERAAVAVLSYHYKSLEADRDAAAKFLTPGYRDDYVKTFELVQKNAPKVKANVEAEVLASSAMPQGGEQDPDRVPVLLFVDQTTTSTANSGEPSVALNRVRLDMVNQDGTWLVDGITSY